MNALAFDTHVFVKKLTAAGMPEAQAEVLAQEQTNLIENNLATKRDLEDLRGEVKRDIKELEVALKGDLKVLEQRIIIRLGSMMIVAVGAVAALVKLL